MSTIELKLLDPRMADYLPAYATPGSAGLDLRACIDAPLQLLPGGAALTPVVARSKGRQAHAAVKRIRRMISVSMNRLTGEAIDSEGTLIMPYSSVPAFRHGNGWGR
mgnify:CR=1 FL=1